MLTTATINILSQVGSTLEWEKTGNIGIIATNETSELYIKAELSPPSFPISYNYKSGGLPPGLTLERDGTIKGIPQQYLSTPTSSTYTFSAEVIDSTGYSFSEKEFTISVLNTFTAYTSVYFKPYLSLEKRKEYSDFVYNKNIFIPEFIYRPFDSNFGIQKELNLILHFGIQIVQIPEYVSVLQQNFSKRKVRLGELKTATAKLNGNSLYDLIYVDIQDDLDSISIVNSSTSFLFNGEIYYPATINNMRKRFIDNNNIRTTENLNPKFLKTPQGSASLELGYIPFIPICYCIPGKSQIILKKIKEYNFKFNKINFELDRLLIKDSDLTKLDNTTNYVLFGNRN